MGGGTMTKFDVLREIRELKNHLSYSKNIGFFFGAGTSCALGIPDIATLTRDVEAALDGNSVKIFRVVKDDLATLTKTRAVNIEDILNQLRRIRELTKESETKTYLEVCGKDAMTVDGEICRAIYKLITEKESSASLATTKRFFAWYNLLTRDIEYELLPLCASEDLGVCVYNPLAAGLLTGKHNQNEQPAEGTRFTLERLGPLYYGRYWSMNNFDAVSHLKQIAVEHGRSPAQFAIAWILSNKTVTAAICGATSAKQLEENLEAVELSLSQEELDACDEVWQQLSPRPKLFYGR